MSARTKQVLDDDRLGRLNLVRVPEAQREFDRFPDFLIVGPQRTGTTWLHAHLRFHPQVFLAEPKELFFFSSLKNHHGSRFHSNQLDWYLQHFQDSAWRWLLKSSICMWRFRERYRPIVRGEATASYSTLDRDVIDEITALNPHIKIVLMIRNPVDRAWSHAKKDLLRKSGRRPHDVGEDEFRAFFTDEYQLRCARYVENYENWTAHVKKGHLFVRVFDEISIDPDRLLFDLMAFLGVRADRRYISSDVRQSVNPTRADEIPARYATFLQQLFSKELRELQEKLGVSWPVQGR